MEFAVAVQSDAKHALLALNRFGYGPRGAGNDLAAATGDPRGLLKLELGRPDAALAGDASLPSSRDALQALFAERQRVQAMREKKPGEADASATQRDMQQAETKPATPGEMVQGEPKPETQARAEPPIPQQLFRAEALLRFRKVAAAETGYV